MGTGLLKCPVSFIMCYIASLKVSTNSSFAAAWFFPGLLASCNMARKRGALAVLFYVRVIAL